MEFEWVNSETTCQNVGRILLSRGSSRPQHLQASISSISSPTATNPSALNSSTSSSAADADSFLLPKIPSVPVPLITVGKVFAPIPQGRQTIHPESMAAARHLGLAPMLAAALGTGLQSSPDEFWDIASLTDPLTASNLMQVSSLGQRRLLFVERGAAERLARGKDELIAAAPGKKQRVKGVKDRDGEGKNGVLEFLKALNPLVALEGVCDALERGISKTAALDSSPLHEHRQLSGTRDKDSGGNNNKNINSNSSSNSSSPVLVEEGTYRIEPKEKEKSSFGKSTREGDSKKKDDPPAAASSLFDAPFPSTLSVSPFEEDELFGSAAGVHRGSGMAALAHIPVRLALSLLRGASGRFLLLSGRGEGKNTKRQAKQNKRAENSNGQHSQQQQQPELYGGADSLNSLQIYFLPKCDFIISSTSGDIKFTPGFLSEAALQKYYKKWVDGYIKGLRARRRLIRRARCQNLRLATAVVAGAGSADSRSGGFGGGGVGGGGNDEDEEDDGFGESPDIYEAIKEISEEMPGFPEASPTLRPSSSPLIRAGATLATGVITLLDPLIESYGDVADSISNFFMERLNQHPYKLAIASRPLGPLLKSFASYNATQAQAAAGARSPSQSSQNTVAAAAAATDDSADAALALAGVCMAVGAKLTGDALSNGPIEILPSLSALFTTLASFSVGPASGGGWASTAAAAAAASAQSNGDARGTELTAILRSVLPSLEFNGFTEVLSMAGDEKTSQAAAATVEEVLLKETGFLGLTAEVDLHARPEQFLEDMNLRYDGTTSTQQNEEQREVTEEEKKEVRPTPTCLGRGLVLIGDPGRVLGLRTPRGFSLDGVGIPVGVDDGRRYL